MGIIGDTIKIPVISSLPYIRTAQNNKLEIAGFTGYICFSKAPYVPHCNSLRPSNQGSITLHPFISNPISYLTADAELGFRLLDGFT